MPFVPYVTDNIDLIYYDLSNSHNIVQFNKVKEPK